MELRQLEYFIAVAEEANFTRAAQRVHVAQPGVSAQIRRLEREFGHDLLDRSGRTVRLTDVGAAVLPYARAALAAVADARLAVDELAGLTRGRVSVGMVTACSTPALFDLLAAFHRRHPEVEINLSEANSDSLIEAVRDGRLDLAVIGVAANRPPDLHMRDLRDEHLVAAVRHDDPLATKRTITLSALVKRPLVCLPAGTGMRTSLDEACARASLRPHIALEASDPHVLASLAARGLGVAILSTSLAAAHRDDLRAIPITRPQVRARLALAWRSAGPTGPAARALIAQALAVRSGPR